MSGVSHEGRCPNCGYRFDSFMRVGGTEWKAPSTGSLGVCIECGDVYRFTVVGPKSLPKEEYEETLRTNPTIRKVLSAWAAVQRGKP